ncbi:MAG: lytic transglycosylase domain-containing protein [Alphaproteobacteria bacterium]
MVKPIAVAVLVVLFLMGAVAPGQAGQLSDTDQRLYRAAFAAADNDEWNKVHSLTGKAHNRLPGKVLRWMEYVSPRSGASFMEITDFVRNNPDWPQQSALARRAEDAITPSESPEAMLAWFIEHPPQTPNGKVAWARTLMGTGRPDKAVAVLRDAWINDNFGVVQEKQFVAQHGDKLRREDHIARLNRLLWDRQLDAVKRMMPRVDQGHQRLAQARIAMIEMKGGVEGALAKVPPELRGDPGLLYERVRWRRKKDLYSDAIALFGSPGVDKVRPDMWWVERAALAREALHMGMTSKAYSLASHHGKLESSQFSDAEWLAGWISLRFLKDARTALTHFKRMHEGVTSPISKARGAYWAGRAAEALDDKAEAETWFKQGAQHVTTYYGQLAAGRVASDNSWPMPEDPLPQAEDIETFGRHELAQAVALLAELDKREHIRPIVMRLVDLARTPGQHALVARLAGTSGRTDVTVSVARRSAQAGVVLLSSNFPVISVPTREPPERALVLSVVRQESNFQPTAVSSAGAQGLMQLLPTTAKQVAKAINVTFTPSSLVTDPNYNMKLGAAYLQQVIDSFDGSYVLAIAAYNAGPARARQWVRDFGNPRDSVVDAVDWVEMIPFSETRNYVQRVLEGLQVYRRRLGATDFVLSLEGDLKR